jgi:hypothetical protein
MDAGGGAFPSTRHSVVRAIADADPDVRREAYGDVSRRVSGERTAGRCAPEARRPDNHRAA